MRKVLAFDIQQDAIKSANELLKKQGLSEVAEVYLDSHEHVGRYAEENSVSAVVFNFGWLPGGNYSINTKVQSCITAIEKSLKLLENRGVMSLSIY